MTMMKLNGKKLTNAVVLSLMLAAPFYASAEEITVSDGQVLTGPQNANANIATTIKGSGTENITFEGDADKQFSLSASGFSIFHVPGVSGDPFHLLAFFL